MKWYLNQTKQTSKQTKTTKNKEGLYIMIKGSIYQEDITMLNVCVTNKIVSKYIRQKLTELKGETDKSTITVEVFYAILSVNSTRGGEQMSKDIE